MSLEWKSLEWEATAKEQRNPKNDWRNALLRSAELQTSFFELKSSMRTAMIPGQLDDAE